jgi:Zn-finger nucleic acid-binding protein
MRCPVCLDADLVPHIRDGIEVDHCGRCRGMWLDRGELEKLLDLVEARSPEVRITSPEPPRVPAPLPSDLRRGDRHNDDDRDRYRDERDRDDDRHRGRKRKRRSPFAELLEEVFEGFD